MVDLPLHWAAAATASTPGGAATLRALAGALVFYSLAACCGGWAGGQPFSQTPAQPRRRPRGRGLATREKGGSAEVKGAGDREENLLAAEAGFARSREDIHGKKRAPPCPDGVCVSFASSQHAPETAAPLNPAPATLPESFASLPPAQAWLWLALARCGGAPDGSGATAGRDSSQHSTAGSARTAPILQSTCHRTTPRTGGLETTTAAAADDKPTTTALAALASALRACALLCIALPLVFLLPLAALFRFALSLPLAVGLFLAPSQLAFLCCFPAWASALLRALLCCGRWSASLRALAALAAAPPLLLLLPPLQLAVCMLAAAAHAASVAVAPLAGVGARLAPRAPEHAAGALAVLLRALSPAPTPRAAAAAAAAAGATHAAAFSRSAAGVRAWAALRVSPSDARYATVHWGGAACALLSCALAALGVAPIAALVLLVKAPVLLLRAGMLGLGAGGTAAWAFVFEDVEGGNGRARPGGEAGGSAGQRGGGGGDFTQLHEAREGGKKEDTSAGAHAAYYGDPVGHTHSSHRARGGSLPLFCCPLSCGALSASLLRAALVLALAPPLLLLAAALSLTLLLPIAVFALAVAAAAAALAAAPSAYAEASALSGLELALAFAVALDRATDIALAAGCCSTATGSFAGEAFSMVRSRSAPPPMLLAGAAALLHWRRVARGRALRQIAWSVGVRGARGWWDDARPPRPMPLDGSWVPFASEEEANGEGLHGRGGLEEEEDPPPWSWRRWCGWAEPYRSHLLLALHGMRVVQVGAPRPPAETDLFRLMRSPLWRGEWPAPPGIRPTRTAGGLSAPPASRDPLLPPWRAPPPPPPPATDDGSAAVHEARQRLGGLAVAGVRLGWRSGGGRTAAHVAAACGHTEALRALAMLGAPLHARDEGGRTPMDVAASAGHGRATHLLATASRGGGRGPDVR